MIEKIFDALKQGYGKGSKLGLADGDLRGVATSLSTLITSEEQIPTFVAGAEAMLKNIQSSADRVRTEFSSKLKALETENSELKSKVVKKPDEEPKPDETDMAKIIAQAVSDAIKPISDEFTAFKANQSAKEVYMTAKSSFDSNDYVKNYKREAEDAWDRANELYEALGKTWTAEEFTKKAMGYFTKSVANKGVDTSKPYEADNRGGAEELNIEAIRKALVESGRITNENK